MGSLVLQAASRVVVAAVSSSKQEVEASLGAVSGRLSSSSVHTTSRLLHTRTSSKKHRAYMLQQLLME